MTGGRSVIAPPVICTACRWRSKMPIATMGTMNRVMGVANGPGDEGKGFDCG